MGATGTSVTSSSGISSLSASNTYDSSIGSGGNQQAQAQRATRPTSPVPMTQPQIKQITNEFQRMSADYASRVQDFTGASQDAKTTWQNISSAAQRLANYGGIPSLTSGYAAAAVFEALPSGSTIEVSNAKNTSDNGTWIRGSATRYGSQPVWTHIADANGNRLSRADGTTTNRGNTEWLSRIANDDRTTQLRVKKYK